MAPRYVCVAVEGGGLCWKNCRLREQRKGLNLVMVDEECSENRVARTDQSVGMSDLLATVAQRQPQWLVLPRRKWWGVGPKSRPRQSTGLWWLLL